MVSDSRTFLGFVSWCKNCKPPAPCICTLWDATSRADLCKMRVKELKAQAKEKGIDISTCTAAFFLQIPNFGGSPKNLGEINTIIMQHESQMVNGYVRQLCTFCCQFVLILSANLYSF